MVETIEWTAAGVVMIDQRLLPRQQVFVTCRTYQEVAEAIKTMVIRGAPAIGVAAAMGVALGARPAALIAILFRPEYQEGARALPILVVGECCLALLAGRRCAPPPAARPISAP